MGSTMLNATRQRMGYGMMAVIFGGLVWASMPDLPPWLVASSASGSTTRSPSAVDPEPGPGEGRALPLYTIRTCAGCHRQGEGGFGGGANYRFAFRPESAAGRGSSRFEALTVPCDPASGTAGGPALAALAPWEEEPAGTAPINAPAIRGLGLVDRLPAAALLAPAAVPATAPRVAPGRARVLADGRVGRFGWKAQFASLEEYLSGPCLGEPSPDARPAAAAAVAVVDPKREIPLEHLRFLRSGLAGLPRPVVAPPATPAAAESARRGEAAFAAVGCVACHPADRGEVRGVYGDFLLHRLAGTPGGPAPAPTDEPLPGEWRTPPLWGVADSAPYLHDGSAPTLEVAIARHLGDAEPVTRAFEALDPAARGDIVAFLKTLRAPGTFPRRV